MPAEEQALSLLRTFLKKWSRLKGAKKHSSSLREVNSGCHELDALWVSGPVFLPFQCGTVVRECLTEDSYVLSLMSPLSLFKRNSTLLPGTEVIVWGRLGSPLVNILFLTKLLSLAPLSWDMDCLLTLWLRLPLVPLVTVASIWFSDLYHSWKKFLVPQPIYTHRKIIKAPLLHQSLGPCLFCLSLSLSLSFSLFFWLILWSMETRHAYFPAQASKTLSRRYFVPSPPWGGAWCLREQCKSCVKGFIGFLCKPGNISLFLSFTFFFFFPPLFLSYHRLCTTRFQSIKGPQQVAPEQGHWYTWHFGWSDSGPVEVGKY